MPRFGAFRIRHTLRRGAGSALIEALVALLIFSVGVLGMVGLQGSMTRAQSNARYRAAASDLTAELIGMVWADGASSLPNYATTPGAACSYQRCADWIGKVAAALPAGTAAASADPSSGALGVTLTWSLANEGTHSYVLSTSVQR